MANFQPVPRPPYTPPRANAVQGTEIIARNVEPARIIGWTYPIQHYSPQFETINAAIRWLDDRFEALPTAKKIQWDSYYDPLMNQWLCGHFDEDGNYIITGG